MRRQTAAMIAVLGLVVASCTSSAGAGDDLANVPSQPRVSSQEAQVSRMVENFFMALQERNPYALYALFSPDDQCHPSDIEELLTDVQLGVAVTSEVDVDDLTLRPVGSVYSINFKLVERQGSSDVELIYDEFFPIEETDYRWRFVANVCDWLSSPAGDADVKDELRLALAALEAFFLETGSYLATGNDLRYYASGLSVTMDELQLMPGEVLVVPGDAQTVLVGQGVSGSWYCIAAAPGLDPVYNTASSIEDIYLFEGCAAGGSSAGW